MKSFLYTTVFAVCLISCNKEDATLIPSEKSQTETSTEVAAKGELFVKFNPEMTEALDKLATQTASRSSSAISRSGIPSTDEVLEILRAYSLQRIFPIDANNEERTRKAGLHLWYKICFDESIDIEEAKQKLSALGEVTLVQSNPVIKRSYRTDKKAVFFSEKAVSRSFSRGNDFPFNDKYLPDQWGYINIGNYDFDQNRTDGVHSIAGADVNCKEAWKLCQGDPSIIVAVLDEGVMFNHPDLEANMWKNESETFGSDEDADGNGYKGDVYGYNFVRDNGVISCNGSSDTGHATHVSGTIAAVNNNGIGVCGIAGGDGTSNSGVKIMSCQIFEGETTATLWGEARAIKYAADNGAVILQCSWGYNSALSNPIYGYTPGYATEKEWAETYPLEKEVLDYFIHNAGSPNGVIEGGLAVFASGNEYAGMSAFPAAYSECVSVSAIAADFTPSTYSNYGTEVMLSAPGGDSDYHGTLGVRDEDLGSAQQGMILSTMARGNEAGYGYYEGTSMACPHVSGIAALGLSYAVKLHKHFKASEFKNLLISSGSDLDQYYTGKKTYHYNHSSAGASITQMDLSEYRGKMGRLANAGDLLKAIASENTGSAMKLPNVYIAPGKEQRIALSYYFDKGETQTYSATSASTNIATAVVANSILCITGIQTGITTVSVKTGSGKEQTIVVTVRKNAGDKGWM